MPLQQLLGDALINLKKVLVLLAVILFGELLSALLGSWFLFVALCLSPLVFSVPP